MRVRACVRAAVQALANCAGWRDDGVMDDTGARAVERLLEFKRVLHSKCVSAGACGARTK